MNDTDSIPDVGGIEIGHAQDIARLTGCTVILCREGATVGVDVRGGAPGTRETDLCRPGNLVRDAHAVLLTGGSAFGLDAAGGVMRFLHERNVGQDTGVTRVPIVPAAVIYDLGVGGVAWPDAEMAYRACEAASSNAVEQGCVGAGTGATVGKLLGIGRATKSGVGSASVRVGEIVVGALFVVNALGDVVDPSTGEILAGARDPSMNGFAGSVDLLLHGSDLVSGPGENTTIGVVATDARLTVEQSNYVARVAHDGLARAIRPVHTLYDGDTVFVLATGRKQVQGDASLLAIGVAAVEAVERSVVRAVRHATSMGNIPAARDLA